MAQLADEQSHSTPQRLTTPDPQKKYERNYTDLKNHDREIGRDGITHIVDFDRALRAREIGVS